MANRKGSIRTTVEVDEAHATITFVFGKGTGDEWYAIDRVSFEVDELPSEMYRQMALYGARKALMDRTSDQSDPMQKADDPRVKIDAMIDLWDRLFMQGQWKEPSKASGGGGPPLVVEAIAEYKGVSVAQAQKAWKAQDDDQKAKIQENEEIKAIMERKQAERQQSEPVDLDDLTGDL